MPSKILIVEDEILIALEAEAVFRDLGHHPVGIAATSDEALALAAEHEPDIALIDVNLADGPTGPDVGADLAKRGVAVVFVTANPRLVPRQTNAIGVLDKPADEADLAALLAYVTSLAGGAPGNPPARLRAL